MQTIPNSIKEYLDTPYSLNQDQIDFYKKNLFIKLKEVLNQ